MTNTDALIYLLNTESECKVEKMPGTIRTKQKCEHCGKSFEHIRKIGYICKEHLTRPTRYFIDVYFGRQVKIYSHKNGLVLSSYDLAEETLKHIQYEIRNKTFDPSHYIKSELENFYFSNVAKKWISEKLTDVDQGLKAYSYVKGLQAYNEKYFKPHFNNRDLREIRRYHIDEFKESLPHHLSPKTIKNIFIALKNLFIIAYGKELIEKVPQFPIIDVPQYSGWKWIDSEVQINILSVLSDTDKPIFIFLFLHGTRPGEARALKIKDIDLNTKTIRIRRTFSLNELRESTKQKKENIIPIHPEFLPYLKRTVMNSLPEAFVFVNNKTGKPYNGETLRKKWHSALKTAGMQFSGLRLYDASRHSFASQLVNSNVPINIVSKLLGHSSVKMTQRYAHEDLNTLKSAIETISLNRQSEIETIPRLSPAQNN